MPFTYQQWRLQVYNNDSTSTATSIGDWKFYDSGNNPIPTTSGVASASSQVSGDEASKAFDGNPSTFWASTKLPTFSNPDWLSYSFPGAVTGQPAVVQSRATVNASSGSFSNPVTSGNLIVAILGDETALTAATVSDSLGTSYSVATIASGSTNLKAVYGIAPASGTCTITFTGYTSPGWSNIAFLEIANAQAVLDGTAVSGTSGATSPGSLTTTANNSIVIVGLDGFHSSTVWTQPTGWTLFQASGHDAVGIAYTVQTTAGTVSPTFTGANTDSDTQVMFAFKVASSAFTFGGPATVSSFSISCRSDGAFGQSPTAFSLMGSNDGTTWTTIGNYCAVDWVSAGQVQTFPVGAFGLGTIVRLLITADANVQSTSIGECLFYDSSGNYIPTPVGATAASVTGGYSYASDVYNNSPASCAFDNNPNTMWASVAAPTSGSPSFLAYQFSSTTITLGRVVIRARNDVFYGQAPSSFSLQTSTDQGSTWTTLFTTTATWTSSGQVQGFDASTGALVMPYKAVAEQIAPRLSNTESGANGIHVIAQHTTTPMTNANSGANYKSVAPPLDALRVAPAHPWRHPGINGGMNG